MIQDPWYREADCSVADFAASIEDGADPGSLQLACDVQRGIPIYDCAALRATLDDPVARPRLLGEWLGVLMDGAGVFALRGAFSGSAAIDEATAIFEAMIVEERERGIGGADHFAKPGANDGSGTRWRSSASGRPRSSRATRQCLSRCGRGVARAALSGHVTDQCRSTRGQAQEAHRDYHLGFQTVEEAQRYPGHVPACRRS